VGTREVRILESPCPLVLLVDISGSMAVEDVPGNRLASARLLIRRVAHRLPGTALGLTAFARDSHPLLPPGRDRDLLLMYLDALEPGMITNQGTSLLSPLATATRMIREPETGVGTVFLLLSDGENPGVPGDLQAKAELLRKEGAFLATVALGTRKGGPVPHTARVPTLRTRQREEALSPAIPPAISRSDPETLRELARAGGGIFASASDPVSVEKLISWLEERVGARDTGEARREGADRWAGLVTLALLLLVAEASFRDPLARSLPAPGGEEPSP
jgi:Ca-activated chloride channel family protein